uniref:Glutathione-regulated potassium-efflux system protein KefB n=1 Tax=uncultured Thiotrichaceae bacterium TaxID=298394 RepID=A0A6S6SLL0_9GAMM|nr:MAG: Glutathione-regulated potassium-efflux system protein KefB [uncultured Thiotrichaceae bacterium]
MEHETGLLQGVLLLLVMSVAAVGAFRLFKLPPILGYLVVGALTGEYALGWLPANHEIEFMGEVGVVFLLFAIGLEFSVKQFLAMKTTVLGLGGLQVVLSTLAGFGILYFFGMSWEGAIIAGGALALSSTAIVVKQLSDQGEMRARHGQLAISILLFQDIAVVPFLIIIPILGAGAGEQVNTSAAAIEMLINIFTLAGMLLAAHYVLRPLFHHISKAQSVELFNITVLLVALTAAWITQSLGLSLALGAFLAGMLLSETEYKHQIEAEIRPFRDILMGLFFIVVGTKLNPGVLPELWLPILLLVLGLTVGKAILIALLSKLFAADNGTSLRTGLVLAQGGEFGFALLALALGNGLLSNAEVQSVLAAVIISMALAPFFIRYSDTMSRKLFSDSYLKQRYKAAHDFSLEVKEVEKHVIICGYRRIGQSLSRFLQEQGIPYIGLELDPTIVREAWEAGDSVYFADATRPEILIAAGLYRARMVVITVADVESAKLITAAARKKQADIPILVRTRNDICMNELEELGATSVLPETLETSLIIAERVLEELGLPGEEVSEAVQKIRADGYRSLKSYFHGEQQGKDKGNRTLDDSFLRTVVLKEDDRAVGKTIGELKLENAGVFLKSVKRGDIRGDSPSPTMRLQIDDRLVLESKSKNFQTAEKRLIGIARKETKDSNEDKKINAI